MASIVGGPVTWSLDRDDAGYRTYRVTWRVKAAVDETPRAVMLASGMPSMGAVFGVVGYSGADPWVWCRPEMSVKIDQERKGDPAVYYLVERIYSNHDSQRCHDYEVGDPMMEPMKVSGSFNRAQYEARYDGDGAKLVTSANEPIIGAEVTFDYVRPTVRIEQNVAALGLSTFSAMVNTVNDSPLWGLPARCIKLTNAPWTRQIYGACNFFYVRTFDFEVDFYAHDKDYNPIGFDKDIYDAGSMGLAGMWLVDYEKEEYGHYQLAKDDPISTKSDTIMDTSPGDFTRYKDLTFENAKVHLDGHGRPANSFIHYPSTTSGVEGALVIGEGFDKEPWFTNEEGKTGPPARSRLKFYRESNFLELGIPTSF